MTDLTCPMVRSGLIASVGSKIPGVCSGVLAVRGCSGPGGVRVLTVGTYAPKQKLPVLEKKMTHPPLAREVENI